MLGFDAEKWGIIPSFPRLPAHPPAFITFLMRCFNHAPPKASLVGTKVGTKKEALDIRHQILKAKLQKNTVPIHKLIA